MSTRLPQVAELDALGLVAQLSASFNPVLAREFDGTVVLELDPGSDQGAAQRVVLILDHGKLQTRVTTDQTPADITLYFHSAAEAAALLQGSANPVTAFMEGRFRSDGYLIWVFSVLSMFRPG